MIIDETIALLETLHTKIFIKIKTKLAKSYARMSNLHTTKRFYMVFDMSKSP